MVRDRALRPTDRGGQLGHASGPLEHEIEDRASQRVGDGPQPGEGSRPHGLRQPIDRQVRIARHFSNSLKYWTDPWQRTDRVGPRTKEAPMAEVLLFHHAQGQTAGFLAFADALRRAGHTV